MAQNKTNAFELSVVDLIFKNSNIAGIGDATGVRGSTVAGELFIALLTGPVDEDQTDISNEVTTAAYENYQRKGVVRSASGWTTTTGVTAAPNTGGAANPSSAETTTHGAKVTNTAAVTFDQAGALSTGAVITHMAICKAGTRGVADVLYAGPLNSSLTVNSGVTPQFAIGAIVLYEY